MRKNLARVLRAVANRLDPSPRRVRIRLEPREHLFTIEEVRRAGRNFAAALDRKNGAL